MIIKQCTFEVVAVAHTDEAICNSKRFVVNCESYDVDITFG